MGRSWRRAVSRLAIGGLAGALLMVLGLAPSATAVPVSHFRINANATLTEGDAGVTNLTFTISYTGTKNNISVDWATADGTATAGADYVSSSGTASFTVAGPKSQTISIPVNGDLLDEANETFTVNLTNPQPAATADITTPTRTGRINDNDPTPSLVIDDVALPEGDSGATNATFTVSLSAPSGRNVTVRYATANSTASQPSDYTTTSGTLTLAPGVVTRSISVPVVGGTSYETDELFFLNLSSGVNATIADNRGVATILNDDAPPSLSIDDASRIEGNSGSANLTFTVRLTPASGSTVTVSYATSDASANAPADYLSRTGTVTFSAGQTSRTITVPVVGDTLDEDDETFVVGLSTPANATIADTQGVGTIVDNDASPSISINNVTVTEGNAGTVPAAFSVTMSRASGRVVSVDYATTDLSATGPADYTPTSGTLTFAPGQITKAITVDVMGEVLNELTEAYRVTLSNPFNVTVTTATGTGTITNDDPVPTVSVGDLSVAESDAGTAVATITVSLSGASGKAITVEYATADGTADATDYTGASGTLAFAPGETVKTVGVDVFGDPTYEGDEVIAFILSNPVNVVLGGPAATVTVLNDDLVPQIAVDHPSSAEGDIGTTTATFTLSLSNPSAFPITVDHVTVDTTASSPEDYAASTGTLTFAPGETTKTLDVQIQADTVYEQDETFAVDLLNPSGAVIVNGHGVATIVDDDAPPVLDIADVTIPEGDVGDSSTTFVVTLTGATQLPVTVDVSTADGLAIEGVDFSAVAASLTFALGETTKTVDVTVHGDTTFELDETFMVELSNITGAAIGDGLAIGTIANDDSAPGLGVADVSLPEGDAGDNVATFTVTLDAPSALPVSVDVATADGSATQPSDFDPVTTTLTFAPGEVAQSVDVTVHGDTTVEPDETFLLALSNEAGASIGSGVGTGTVINDDAAPAPADPRVAIGDATEPEGDSGTTSLTFPVTLSDVSVRAVTVVYRTVPGSATAGIDYRDATGSVRIPAGQLSASIQVLAVGDGHIEPDESFTLEITGIFGARPGPAATGTITNDDRERTRITLRAKGAHRHVIARGRLLHAEPAMRVRVVLLKKLGSGYVKVAHDTVKVRIRARGDMHTGIFATRFTHRSSGRYVVRAVFRGDAMHQPAHARVRVRL